MQYIPETLKEYIYKKNLSLEQMINLGKQLTSAIETMHRSGVVHRDLKPENILIQN